MPTAASILRRMDQGIRSLFCHLIIAILSLRFKPLCDDEIDIGSIDRSLKKLTMLAGVECVQL